MFGELTFSEHLVKKFGKLIDHTKGKYKFSLVNHNITRND